MNNRYIKFTLLIFLFCFFTNSLLAQIKMPKSGSVSQSVVGGELFYDSGDSGANYGNNESGIITFNSAAGTVIRVTFNEFNVEDANLKGNGDFKNYYDILKVYDGGGVSSSLLGVYYGSREGAYSNKPNTIISSGNQLTFSFESDALVEKSGWKATIEVIDVVPPTVLCQDVVLQLDNTGNANLIPSQVDNGSSDNVTAPEDLILSVDPSSFDCSDIFVPGENYALDFDGVNDYVDLGNPSALQITGKTITVEAWFKLTTAEDWSAMVMKTFDGNWRDGYGLYYYGGNICFFVNKYYYYAHKFFSADEQWHHIAGVYDGSQVRIYVDGVEGTPYNYSSPIGASSGNLNIGRGASNLYNLNGAVDEVRIWNIARSEQEINATKDVELIGNENGLVGYWNFNDGPGSGVLTDATANESSGSLTNMDAQINWVSGAPVESGDHVSLNVMDASGNVGVAVSKLTIVDAQPPSFNSIPGDLNEDDIKPLPYSDYSSFEAAGGEVRDNCTVDFASFKFESDVIVSNNPEIVDRTYSIADNSGNVAKYVQTITINTKPKITDFNPKNACEGGEIVITGSNFTDAISVDFNGTSTSLFVVDNDSKITVSVPVGVTSGFLKVVNSNGFGESGDPLTISQPHRLSAIVIDNDCGEDNKGEIDLTVDAGINASLDFTSTSNPVDLNQNFLSGRGAFTLEGWVKFTANMSSGQHSFFGQNDVIEFGFESGSLTCWTAQAGNVKYTINNYLTDNEWHHVAAVGTGSSLKLYIDGVEKISVDHTSVSSYGSSAYSVKIGAGVWDGVSTDDPFTGEISVVRFWEIVRTETELSEARFLKMTGNETGLLAAYRLDEASGSVVSGVGSEASTVTISDEVKWVVNSSPYIYNWSNGSTTEDIVNLSSGTYSVRVSVTGCSVEDSYTVVMKNPKPKPIGIFFE